MLDALRFDLRLRYVYDVVPVVVLPVTCTRCYVVYPFADVDFDLVDYVVVTFTHVVTGVCYLTFSLLLFPLYTVDYGAFTLRYVATVTDPFPHGYDSLLFVVNTFTFDLPVCYVYGCCDLLVDTFTGYVAVPGCGCGYVVTRLVTVYVTFHTFPALLVGYVRSLFMRFYGCYALRYRWLRLRSVVIYVWLHLVAVVGLHILRSRCRLVTLRWDGYVGWLRLLRWFTVVHTFTLRYAFTFGVTDYVYVRGLGSGSYVYGYGPVVVTVVRCCYLLLLRLVAFVVIYGWLFVPVAR